MNNQFNVGDIICHKHDIEWVVYWYLITDVKPNDNGYLATYCLLQLATGGTDMISFDSAHRMYLKKA